MNVPFIGRRLKARGGIAYVPGDSFLHRANPLTKLLALVAVTAVSLAFRTPLPLAALLGALVFVAGSCRLLRPLSRAYILVLPFLAFIVILDAFFGGTATGTVYLSYSFGWLRPELTSGRVEFAVAMGFRLLVIATTSVLFILTTDYSNFVRSLRILKIPESLSFSLAYALRSVTGLHEDVTRIMDAQRSRGMEFDRKMLTKNRNRVMAVTIPMTVAVLHRSRHVSDAMQSRGFGASPRVSRYNIPGFSSVDAAIAGVLVLLVTAAFIL